MASTQERAGFIPVPKPDLTPKQMLQRYFRDMTTLRTHNTLQYDRLMEAFAKTHWRKW